jgi:hypothetical protein
MGRCPCAACCRARNYEICLASDSVVRRFLPGRHQAVLRHFVVQRDTADAQLFSSLSAAEGIACLFDDFLLRQFDAIASVMRNGDCSGMWSPGRRIRQ